ncbi:MAG TPA: HNH endonuclease [Acidimicrobiales bacterium]|nr:HNH endonuclease [Acidimicrobiales bacterium]
MTGDLAGLGTCPLAVGDNPGHCGWCGVVLKGRRTRWCSDEHRTAFANNHEWTAARKAAVERDGHACTRCDAHDRLGPDGMWIGVQLQVNHIEPRCGRGYGNGCHHHLDNLETLCHPCHVETTNEQRRARMVSV